MDASCKLQDNIHKFKLNIYVSRILGTHQLSSINLLTSKVVIKIIGLFYCFVLAINEKKSERSSQNTLISNVWVKYGAKRKTKSLKR